MRCRADSGAGAFTGADLEPAVVTVEGPGSACTLGESMVHQAVMVPHTVTLFVRGRRRRKLSHAADELMPPPDNWPACADTLRSVVSARRPLRRERLRRARPHTAQRS
nr:hypothetical protein [Streptomyces hygroscopicus]